MGTHSHAQVAPQYTLAVAWTQKVIELCLLEKLAPDWDLLMHGCPFFLLPMLVAPGVSVAGRSWSLGNITISLGTDSLLIILRLSALCLSVYESPYCTEGSCMGRLLGQGTKVLGHASSRF